MQILENIIIVKIGTTTLLHKVKGAEVLDKTAFQRIGNQIIDLKNRGYNVIIVSSGAVTAGLQVTETKVRPSNEFGMPEIQRLASIGWRYVLNAWHNALEVEVGEILVTKREIDVESPEHDEVLRTVYTLLKHGNIPIINENDSITHSELSHQSFGQNDTLSAIIAAQIAGSKFFGDNIKLVLLSDVDGLYEDINKPDSIIKNINSLQDVRHLAGESSSAHGKGGMVTKLEAANIACSKGVEMFIANGKIDNAIQLAIEGKIGTKFHAQ